jgi:DNA-binding CsgD family transcriptional regulator
LALQRNDQRTKGSFCGSPWNNCGVDGQRVGRAHELKQLDSLAERAAGGRGAIAVVVGEPGIGKTCLAVDALTACERRGFETYLAAASEMEQHRPFGLITDALRVRGASDPGRAEIRRLLRGSGDSGDVGWARAHAGVEFLVAEHVVEYVEDRGESTPVAIVLEDLQWADPSSLMALSRLAREGRRLPLLLICTLRPDPGRPEALALLASLGNLGASQLELGPLSDGDASHLVALLTGAPPGGRLLRLAASANGNPLQIRELVTALQAGATLEAGPDGQVEVAEGQLPASLRRTVMRRLAGLPAATLDLLHTASVLGSAFTVGELQAVLSRPVSELVPGLRAAIAASVLVESGEGLAFRHELVRAAVYEDIPRPVRQAQHREAARLLAEADAPGERVTAHLVLGGGPGGRQAVSWLRRAARDAAARSPAVAVTLLQQARDLCPADDLARARILSELVQPVSWVSRREDLEALCRRGLGGEGRPEDEIAFRTGLCHSLFIQGRLAAAQAAYQQAASATAAEAQHAMLGAWAALSGVMAGDLAAAHAARQIASAQWGPVTAGLARLAVAMAELKSGRTERAVDTLEALAAEGPQSRWGLPLLRAAGLLDLDQVDKARAVLREGISDCAAHGIEGRAAIYHHCLVAVEYAAGNFNAARAEHDTALSLEEGSGHDWGVISLGLSAAIAVHRGELGQAAATVRVGEAEITTCGPQPGDSEVARARYLMALAIGDERVALEAAREAWQRCSSHGYRSQLTWLGADLVRAALAAGEREQAEEAAQTARQVAEMAAAACWKACAARAQGLLKDDPELLLHAVTLARSSHRPLYLALALEDAADALARAGRIKDARPLAVEALDLFAGMEAATDAARARRRWRAASLHLGTRGPRGRPRTGWDSLSNSELRVVRLVAEGRTNRDIAALLFVSRDTVHTQLSSALRKLGLTSRVELATHAVRRGL